MKKIVGIIAAAALATSAFAEINIGSWNRAVVEPIHYDGDTLRSFNGASWGVGAAGGSRTSVSFSASTENAGVVIDLHSNPGIGVGDNSYVWVKPVEMLRVAFGKIDNSWGRLDHCFGAWDASRFSVMVGEGLGGVDRAHRGGQAAQFTLQPVEGLVIDYQANFTTDAHTYDVMWENSSTMIGYKADFGFIRAIINGEQAAWKNGEDYLEDKTTPNATIAVAADITAVENLVLKVGASLPTNLEGFKEVEATDTTWGTLGYAPAGYVKAGVGADYNLDAVAIHGQVELAVNPDKVDDGKVKLGAMGLAIGAGVDFAFNDAWKLITDVRFYTDKYVATGLDNEGKFTYADSGFGGYLGIRQQLTNATFEFGAMLGKRALKNAATSEPDAFQVAVPLTITASF